MKLTKIVEETLIKHYGFKEGEIEELDVRDVYKRIFSFVDKEGIDALFDYMNNKSDFFTAPASTKFHGNFEGALALHSLNVLALFTQKNEFFEFGLNNSQLILSSLCHDLCKCNFYVEDYRNVKVYEGDEGYIEPYKPLTDGSGRKFCWRSEKTYSIEDKFPMGHGDKSVYILNNYIRCDAITSLLIKWHMGPFANTQDNQFGFNNACDYHKAICAIHTADMEASNILEETRKACYVG